MKVKKRVQSNRQLKNSLIKVYEYKGIFYSPYADISYFNLEDYQARMEYYIAVNNKLSRF